MRITNKIISLLLALFLLFPVFCSAAGVVISNPLFATSFEALADSFVAIIWTFAVAVTPLMIIVSGFVFITAAGNPVKIQTAKNILLYTVIGFAIALCSNVIWKIIDMILREPVGG